MAAGIRNPSGVDDGLLLTAAKFGEPVYPSGCDPVGGGGVDNPDGGIFNQCNGLYGSCIRQAQKYQIRRIQQLFRSTGSFRLASSMSSRSISLRAERRS